jgi:elongation of very long chain fatty acids protein 4
MVTGFESLTAQRLYKFSQVQVTDVVSSTAPQWMHFYIDSSIPTLIAQVVYLVIVALVWIKPSLFPKRPKTKATTAVMLFHNLLLVVWSSLMCVNILYQLVSKRYKVVGNRFHLEHAELAFWIHMFDISKVYEFMDTFIMVYRGNLKQVSFLHVYHHLFASSLAWYTSRVGPGGDCALAASINSFIHVVMYSYYFLSTLIEDPGSRKKYLSWGRYLTQLQMVQFVICVTINAASCLLNKRYPWEIPGSNLFFCASLFVLFSQFYIQKWTAGRQSSKKVQ